jgi:dipeptidyl aminopeptidase/acylaminoacyl peptidase
VSSRAAPFLGIVAFSAMVGSVVATRASAGTDPVRSIRAPHAAFSDREGFDATVRPQATPAIFVKTEHGKVLAYPPGPAAKEDAPLVVYLHGVKGRAENGCPFMRAGTDAGWLVCPEPKVKDGEGWSWTGKVQKDHVIVANAIRATRSTSTARVAVGFSQGAYLTVDLLKKKKESWQAIVLLGASVNPDAKMLKARGVKRVVLGASKDEPWHGSLQKNVAKLKRAGIDARFVSLGHVGHMYVGEDTEALREAIAWASAI